jgi:hypothetical protein
MVLCLEDAVTILSKWKDDSADILVVSASPFQQSRRGIVGVTSGGAMISPILTCPAASELSECVIKGFLANVACY